MRGPRASFNSPSGRWAAFAIVVLCVTGQLATVAHRVLVQHVVCVEHGESVHLRAVAPGSARAVSPTADALARASIADATAVGVEDHEHCSLAASRTAPTTHLSVQTFVPPADDARWIAPRLRPPGPSRAPYLVAPKTSPPA